MDTTEHGKTHLERTGANFVFARPLNGGDPYKKAPWSIIFGMNIQNVRPIDYSGETRPYGVATRSFNDGVALKKDDNVGLYDVIS